MAVFSKMKTLDYTCYELGHTWDPYCTTAAFNVGKTVFREALKIYGSLYLVAALAKKRGKDYYLKKFLPETLRSSLFLAANGGLFVASFCFWRKLAGFYFYYNAMLCGPPVCLLSILIENKKRRGLLAVYTSNLAIETLYNIFLSRGYINPIPNGEIWMFSIACAVYFYLFKSKNGLPNSTSSGLQFIVGKYESPDAIYAERAVNNHNVPKSPVKKHLSFLPTFKLLENFKKKLQHSSKHSLCQHPFGCMYYILQGFVRMFGTGFLIQAAFKLFSSITRIIKQPKLLFSSLLHKDCFSLGAFLGCFNGVFRGLNCLLRRLRNKDDDKNGFISGFAAGWMMIWYRSSTLALYTASRLVETLYFKGIDKGYVPYIKWADIIIYSITTAVAFHAAALEPHNLRPAYWKFLNKVTDNKFAEMNRHLMDVFGVQSSSLFKNFWPIYDRRFTDLTKEKVGLK